MTEIGTPPPFLPPRPGAHGDSCKKGPVATRKGRGDRGWPDNLKVTFRPYWSHLRTELSQSEARGPIIAFLASGKRTLSF